MEQIIYQYMDFLYITIHLKINSELKTLASLLKFTNAFNQLC